MSLSTNQKITVLIAIFGGIITVWSVTYAYSADLVYMEFTPPAMISSNYESNLDFKLNNYGEKKGSYFLSLSSSSKEILFSRDSPSTSDEFKDNLKLGYIIGPKDDDAYNFKLIGNKSNLKPNATVTFIFLDKSQLIYKKQYVWNFYYGLDNNNYTLQKKELFLRDDIIIINDKIIN